MDIHSVLIDKSYLVDLDETTTLCKLPANSTFIKIEDNGDSMAIIYSTPSDVKTTITVDEVIKQFSS
jgi:hypothetical protein